MIRLCHTAIAFVTAMLCADVAAGRELAVGPDRILKVPSQAATIATSGDVVRIDPGTYADCAVWNASHLLIEASGPGVRIAGKICAQRAIFITQGSDITIRGITFANATVLWHNAAGILATGSNLTVENSSFLNNENGILTGGSTNSVVRVTDSTFIGNGSCIDACAHGIYAGAPIYLLDVEHCVFLDTKVAHHIKSRARNTIIRDSRIEDGATGTASYLVDIPNGGNLLIQDNVLEKGAETSNPSVAISIGAEGVRNPTNILIVRDNQFRSDVAGHTLFVRNSTQTAVALSGNAISGNVGTSIGPGHEVQ